MLTPDLISHIDHPNKMPLVWAPGKGLYMDHFALMSIVTS